MERKLGSTMPRTLALALAVASCTLLACGDDAAGGVDDVEPGVSCFEAAECGSLECLCLPETGQEYPGVCSTTCETDADCADRYGDEYSCSIDHCTGVSLCLNLVE